MQVLANIQKEAIHWIGDQITQINVRLQRIVVDLTRKVRSTMVATAAPT